MVKPCSLAFSGRIEPESLVIANFGTLFTLCANQWASYSPLRRIDYVLVLRTNAGLIRRASPSTFIIKSAGTSQIFAILSTDS